MTAPLPEIVIIAALARNNAIGRGGDLLFHMSDDLRRFKALTMGCPIIMGRKTYESFPKRPLPGRLNIVITRNADYPTVDGMIVADSLRTAIVRAMAAVEETGRIYIIGGGEIYRQALPIAHALELTLIDADVPDADTFFPAIDDADWQMTANEDAAADAPGPAHRFVTLRRVL